MGGVPVTPEQAALRDMWLQEMGRPVRELSREDRASQALESPQHAQVARRLRASA